MIFWGHATTVDYVTTVKVCLKSSKQLSNTVPEPKQYFPVL